MLRNTDKSSHFPKKILSDIIMADEEIKIPVVSPRKSIQELEKSIIFNADIKMNEEGKGGLFWEWIVNWNTKKSDSNQGGSRLALESACWIINQPDYLCKF